MGHREATSTSMTERIHSYGLSESKRHRSDNVSIVIDLHLAKRYDMASMISLFQSKIHVLQPI